MLWVCTVGTGIEKARLKASLTYSRTERQRQWHTYDGILTTDANEHISKPFASLLCWVNFLSFVSEKVVIFPPFKQVRLLLSLWVTTVLTLSRFCLMYKSKSCLAHYLTPSTCQCLHSKSPLTFSKSSLTHAVCQIKGLRMREFNGETPNGNSSPMSLELVWGALPLPYGARKLIRNSKEMDSLN